MAEKKSVEASVRAVRRATRKKYTAEEKIRIVLEGLRGESTIVELCRKEGIHPNLYYKWSKEFLEAGKLRLLGDTQREASAQAGGGGADAEEPGAQKKLAGKGSAVGRMMRRSQEEKREIIHLVEHSELPMKRTLDELNVARSTFYRWYQKYQQEGEDGLIDRRPNPRQFWNHIPRAVREQVVQLALEHPDRSSRQLAWLFTDEQGYFISESSVYRILKGFDLVESPAFRMISAKDKFEHPTRRVNELWQTDFTYFKVLNWGWYYLSTILDDYSRCILAWKLTPTMNAGDVQETLEIALRRTGVDQINVHLRPRLLTDNGSCYLSHELDDYLRRRHIEHTRGAPYHPMTQGKIERYHRSMKNVVKLQNYYSPEELEREIADFVDYYNNRRYHESLDNLTPMDVFTGRAKEVLTRRAEIKKQTLQARRLQHLQALAAEV